MTALRPIDADHHYYEPDDCFSRHLESKFCDLAIEPKGMPDGRRPWVMGDIKEVFLPSTSTDRPLRPGYHEGFLTGKRDMRPPLTDADFVSLADHPSFTDRTARLKELDEQGLDACIMLSTAALSLEHDFRAMPDALCANYRSFNRWLEEVWGFGEDGRIFGVPLISLLDVEWAASEVERVAELGARFVFLKTGPVAERSPADQHFDPFWARVQETGIRPIFHVSNAGLTDYYGSHWGEDPSRSLLEYSAFQLLTCFSDRAIEDTLASIILNNLFGRFPGVEVLSIENGSSWVGRLLDGMDKSAKQVRSTGPDTGLRDKPSDVFREHVYVCPYHEEDALGLVDRIGVGRVLFGSDYPHAEGLGDPLRFEEGLVGLSSDAIRKIMRDNTAALVGLDA
jgi:predicted TIM-barrel fold metal-dependent hydrolase